MAALVAPVLFTALLFYLIRPNFSLPAIGQAQSGSTLLAENTPALPGPEQAGSGFPVRLKIPKIGVDAAVVHVGVTPEGAMDVPKGPAEVAWFDLGPRPGQAGSAVISGHYGWKDNISAAFDDLHKLQKGDRIYVEDKEGVTTTFVVSRSRMYGQNEDASAVFGSSDGKAHLNLITCSGTWNKAEKSYSNRLVVFADKE
jgi:LPXTG-site transpeptidase (sortase) family protein